MVRIWRLPVELLDRQHLLGEHVELHVIFNAIVKLKKGIKAGWQKHPQTLRFVDNFGMLVTRHREQVEEMVKRNYNHMSPIVLNEAYDIDKNFNAFEPYTYTKEEYEEDLEILRKRGGLIYEN